MKGPCLYCLVSQKGLTFEGKTVYIVSAARPGAVDGSFIDRRIDNVGWGWWSVEARTSSIIFSVVPALQDSAPWLDLGTAQQPLLEAGTGADLTSGLVARLGRAAEKAATA